MRLRTDQRLLRDLRIARDLGVSLRRFRGWEPDRRIVPDGGGWRIETEPEFDKGQYELMAALYEHEASVNDLGIPLDEAMSAGADPDNPKGTHVYVASPHRDWAEHAMHEAQQDERWSGDNFTPARKWRVTRVDR